MAYLTRQYGSNPRWLLKALREVPHEIEDLVVRLDDGGRCFGLEPRDWCVHEVIGYLRDSEDEDLRTVRAVLRRDGAPIAERRAYLGPGERDYCSQRLSEMLWEFLSLRESLVWMLHGPEEEWEHSGRHPYRGTVPLLTLLHEVNERDLEVSWMLRRLSEAAPARARR